MLSYIILFTCLGALFIRKLLLKTSAASTPTSNLNQESNFIFWKNKSIKKIHTVQNGTVPPNHNYQMQIQYGDEDNNVINRNSQAYIDHKNRMISFGGSVGCKIPISEGTAHSRALNMEMKMFSDEILQLMTSSPPLFDDWYHRKSDSIVLAVCQWKPTLADDCDPFTYTRGINVEVCLATGTICAERTAISQAHTYFPGMKGRHHLSAVAVLELSRDKRNPLLPCGVCQMWLEKLASPDFRVIAYPDRKLNHFIEFNRPWSM